MSGWVYIMANRYRGGMYVGVTAGLPARIDQHREGRGSVTVRNKGLTRLVWAEWTNRIEDTITAEKAHQALATRMEICADREGQSRLAGFVRNAQRLRFSLGPDQVRADV